MGCKLLGDEFPLNLVCWSELTSFLGEVGVENEPFFDCVHLGDGFGVYLGDAIVDELADFWALLGVLDEAHFSLWPQLLVDVALNLWEKLVR